MLGVIFIAFITGSIQSTSADHSLGGKGIFKDETRVNLSPSEDSKYIIHLQVIVRNIQGQLVSVSEVTHGLFIPHKVTDIIFDEILGKKEIVTIDKMRYEKVEFKRTQSVQEHPFPYSYEDMQSRWGIEYCIKTNEHGNEQGISCLPVFQTITAHISLAEDDVFRLNWTILRSMN